MRYRNLGNSGLKVSEIALGGWLNFGGFIDMDASVRLIHHAFAAGVNLFDMADMYAEGRAEIALGRALKDLPRDQVVVATKCRAQMWPGPLGQGLSRHHIIRACEASLKRLDTDYIDLYQVHWPDSETPIAETMAALEQLVRQGKVLYIGCSNFSGKELSAAHKAAKSAGGSRFISSQPPYNLFHRAPENDLFPLCLKEGVGNIVYSPLAHGVLSGKYVPGEKPNKGRLAQWEEEGGYNNDDYFKKAAAVAELAAEYQMTCAQLALRWCLAHKAVTSAIVGASNHDQLDENLRAGNLSLTAQQVKAVAAIAA